MLLVVAQSSGSSPGRQGYKMAVGSDGELCGSIGGGVMEVNLVEDARRRLSVPAASMGGFREQVHRKGAEHASGMICSGSQTVIFFQLSPDHRGDVATILDSIRMGEPVRIEISAEKFTSIAERERPGGGFPTDFTLTTASFRYSELISPGNELYIIGGGHCALALSELMSRLDFRIAIFDDRPDLNTIAKNEYADEIKIVDSYERIGDHIPSGRCAYVVVMTLGYKTDELVIRSLANKEFKYFGVLGSKAKMSVMFKSLRDDGFSDDLLSHIRTPIGLPINSRTPEEIAVSIAAEIIAVKNG